MNEYVTANTQWGDCIARTGCTVNTDALPGMQTHWSTATRYLDEVAIAPERNDDDQTWPLGILTGILWGPFGPVALWTANQPDGD